MSKRPLNYEFNPHLKRPIQYLANYDITVFQQALTDKFSEIEAYVLDHLRKEDTDGVFRELERFVDQAYRVSKVRRPTAQKHAVHMEETNKLFNDYRKCLNGEIEGDSLVMLERYKQARGKIWKEIYMAESNTWTTLLSETNCKKLWQK